ncbi:MAG: prepilin-type N-terminal cleavage/methylation domain-containing protein, partial [Phycisphaerae bacterium]
MGARRQRGFTLIELLVVIMIVGILIALLFPAFQTVLDAANEARCQSNLDQLAKAILTYCQMHDGFLPEACTYEGLGSGSPGGADYKRGWLYGWQAGSGWWSDEAGWLMKLKLVGDPEIFLCPKHVNQWALVPHEMAPARWRATAKRDGKKHNSFDTGDNPTVFGSYAMNIYAETDDHKPRRWDQFLPRHFLLVEEHPTESEYTDGAISPDDTLFAIAERHAGGGYVVCFGGQVIRMTREEFDETKSTSGNPSPREDR